MHHQAGIHKGLTRTLKDMAHDGLSADSMISIPAGQVQSFDQDLQRGGQRVKTVLLVEDEPLNALFLKEVIRDTSSEKKQVRVIHVTMGEEAIKICRNTKIDLVLMDIRLPSMDGLEALREIKQSDPQIPVIVETAYAFPEDRDRALRSGCDAYMAKPISLSLLHHMITKYLD